MARFSLKTPLKTLIVPAVLSVALLGCGNNTDVTRDEYGDPIEADTSTDAPFVAVTQIVEHPALDAVRDGLQDKLKEEGYDEADNSLKWVWESAQGQPATAAQIAQKFVGDNPDLIVAIATPSAQAVVGKADTIPVVFSAVTDPVEAELVSNLSSPGGTVTGVSDLSPINEHLGLISQIVPNVETIGVIYNAGESNSVSLVKLIYTEAEKRGLLVEDATVSTSAEVATAAEKFDR